VIEEDTLAEKILVTGGAGFIGSHIVDTLIAAGYDVAVIDNLHTGKLENVHPSAHFYHVDLRDAEAVERVFAAEHPACVVHEAALADVRGSFTDPAEYATVNVIGTLHLLEAARCYGVRKVLFASTGGAIYGQLANLPATEESPAHPLDPYGASKLACEHYLYLYGYNFGLQYCALRYPNVFGPRQDPFGEAGVVAIFTGKMLRNEPAVINGDGTQQRDFVYVGDIARANLLALDHGNGIYNIGSGIGTDINTIFGELARLTDYQLPESHAPAKQGEVDKIYLNAERARRELGWERQTSLAEGLAQTVQFIRERGARHSPVLAHNGEASRYIA
jgi:UDP-glucose 4-epimerase